jgi:restriction system protein
MKKRRLRAPDSLETLSRKGLPCVVGGLFLLLVPVFHGAFRSLGWALLIFGLVALALPSLIKSLKAQVQETERLVREGKSANSKGVRPVSSSDFGRLDPQWGREPPTPSREDVVDVPSRHGSWSASVFKDIEWRRFEAVCELLFAQAGFKTRAQSHGPDGGVDIWLYSRHAEGAVAVVQCKHWLNQPVGVKELREFLGVMASNKLQRGTFATSSTYTSDAAT